MLVLKCDQLGHNYPANPLRPETFAGAKTLDDDYVFSLRVEVQSIVIQTIVIKQ